MFLETLFVAPSILDSDREISVSDTSCDLDCTVMARTWRSDQIRSSFRRMGETELKRYQKTAGYAFFIIISFSSILVPARMWMSPFLGISPYKMAAASMRPTLQKDDFLMTNPRAYHSQALKRGDLIIFEYSQNRAVQFIMRAAAIERETVEIKNKQVFIDGEPLQESYKVHEDAAMVNTRDNFGPLKIPAGHCFVL